MTLIVNYPFNYLGGSSKYNEDSTKAIWLKFWPSFLKLRVAGVWSCNCSPFRGLRDLLSDIVSDRNHSRPCHHLQSHSWSAMQFLISDYVGNFSLHCLSPVRCFWEICRWSSIEQRSACFLGWGFVMPLGSVDLTIFIQLGNFSTAVSSCRLFRYLLLSAGTSSENHHSARSASWSARGCSVHYQHWRANPEPPHEC